MRFEVEVNGRTVGRLAVGLLLASVVVTAAGPRLATAGSVSTPNAFTAGTTISASQMNANFQALEAEINDNHARIAALEALLAGVTRSGDTVVLTGLNLQVRNGQAGTETADGTGNLIIGHNENVAAAARTGSHYLVIGRDHGYSGHTGLAAGVGHTITADEGFALGGRNNSIGGAASVIVGGEDNTVDDLGLPGETGLLTTTVGAFGRGMEEDRTVDVGYRSEFIDLGFESGVVYVGDDAGQTYLGFAANQVSIGSQAGMIHVGNAAVGVHVGFQAQDVGIGNQADLVSVAGGAGKRPGAPAGPNLGLVMLGQEAVNVSLGTWAVNSVSVGGQAGFDSFGVPTSGQGDVRVGDGARGFVDFGANTQTVYFGRDSANVQVGAGAASVTVHQP